MCFALVIQYAMRVRHVVICSLSRYTIFFHIISKTARFFFLKKRVTEQKICVGNFSTTYIWNIFILRRIKWDIITNARKVFIYIIRYACQILMKLEFCQRVFEKILKYHILFKSSSGSRIALGGRADRQTEATKITVASYNFFFESS